MGASENRRLQYSTLNSRILKKGPRNNVPLIFGNPHVLRLLKDFWISDSSGAWAETRSAFGISITGLKRVLFTNMLRGFKEPT